MQCFIYLLAILPFSEFTAHVTAETTDRCRPGWEQVLRHCYKLPSNDLVTRFEAEKICQVYNAQLFAVDTPADEILLDMLMAKNSTTLIWSGQNTSNTKQAPIRQLSEEVCLSLNVLSGNLVLSHCHSYLPFICEINHSRTTARNHWIEEEGSTAETNAISSRSNILTLSGGILAGIIILALLWIAIGIGIAVYIRQRRYDVHQCANWLPNEGTYVEKEEGYALNVQDDAKP